jgi:tRNA pseudouridine38-40 synthase
MIVLRFEASHFLWRMVRRMTGALVKVGTRAITVDDFAAIVAGGAPHARHGTVAEWTAPAAGLFLERVLYPGDAPLGDVAPAIALAGHWSHTGAARTWTARPVVDPGTP